jgi:hypothetical protein
MSIDSSDNFPANVAPHQNAPKCSIEVCIADQSYLPGASEDRVVNEGLAES